jgi:hypothetical protein
MICKGSGKVSVREKRQVMKVLNGGGLNSSISGGVDRGPLVGSEDNLYTDSKSVDKGGVGGGSPGLNRLRLDLVGERDEDKGSSEVDWKQASRSEKKSCS